MKIAVTGASGLIGTALVPHLRARGHEVIRLVRREAHRTDEVRWDPSNGDVDVAGLSGVEGVVHLSGAGIADQRWTEGYKRTILRSRVESTGTIVRALAALEPRPRVLVSGSGIDFYGDRGDEELTEQSGPGTGFLAEVVRAWEAQTEPAVAAGIRVALARTAVVLAASGGALGRMLPPFKLGLGARLGSGRQWWSWITLADHVRALEFLLTHDLEGPVNLSAPGPVRNADLTKALARALHRPAFLTVPGPALRLALGEMAATVLGSKRVLPEMLLSAGFEFRHPDVDTAARWVADG